VGVSPTVENVKKISAKLSGHEEERLLKVLRKHQSAMGYTLDDLKGISVGCMPKRQ